MSGETSKTSTKARDDYSEAWYDLGAPIFLPSLKYFIAVLQYAVDNYFFVKNTYNALFISEDEHFSHPKIIAVSILGLHVVSSILISILDSFNKDAISGSPGRYLNRKYRLIGFRVLAHITLTMKLFRYTTAYVENRRRNKQLHVLIQRRTPLSEKEIQFVVDQKKNQFVESHYDLVEAFFKTVPAALLQVFFMFQTNPNAKLRLYSTIDQDRFATVFVTIITTAISVANYQADYLAYKKVLNFMDSFRSEFRHDINLTIPGDLWFYTSIPIHILTVGIRICFYSMIIFWSPLQFIITLLLLVITNWILTLGWSKTAWRFRPVLSNPLYGVPWLSFDFIDLWINLFVPGVHYPKPLDYFLNFYTTTFIGLFVFKGFDFLSPTYTETDNMNPSVQNDSFSSYTLPAAFQYLNISDPIGNGSANNTSATITEEEETAYFIGTIVKLLLTAHDFLTLNQINYSALFNIIVKRMNIVNLFCLLYTCAMNILNVYDLDFPVQIVNDFYLSIFNAMTKRKHISESRFQSNNGVCLTLNQMEIFLVFSLLPNSEFFSQTKRKGLKKRSWKSVSSQKLNELVELIIKQSETPEPRSAFCKWVQKLYRKLSLIFYPAKFREPEFNWEIPINKFSVINSIEHHPLETQLKSLIDVIYDIPRENRKILLAVFCDQYNSIVKHYTSLRIKKTFEFLEIPISKGESFERLRTYRGQYRRRDYEIGYWQRLQREAHQDSLLW